MIDEFESHTTGLTSPASSGGAIVPSDITELPVATRIIYVGTSGDLAVRLISGDTVTLRSVSGGAMYPIRVAQVLATGTTAGDIVGLW